jgi:hypothetical protein
MLAGPNTDSACLYQRIRRWSREIWAAVIITMAAAVLLGATQWRMGPSRDAQAPAKPAMTLADQHPEH